MSKSNVPKPIPGQDIKPIPGTRTYIPNPEPCPPAPAETEAKSRPVTRSEETGPASSSAVAETAQSIPGEGTKPYPNVKCFHETAPATEPPAVSGPLAGVPRDKAPTS